TLPTGISSIKLAGGVLEITEPHPRAVQVTVGKEGGVISIQRTSEGVKKISVYFERIYFPPSEKARVVSIEGGRLVAPDLKASKDYQFYARGIEPSGYKNLKREDILGKHPENYAPVVDYLNQLKFRDPDFLALFNLETRSDLEKMKTPETRRQHLLEIAQQVRHRNGSYMVVGQILEELFTKDFQQAKSEITEKQRTEISQEVQKERPKIEKEVRKSLENLKKDKPVEWMQRYPKGQPTEAEFKNLVDQAVHTKTEL